MEKLDCKWFFYFRMLRDVVEELATLGILHDQVQLFGRFNDFIELNNVWMSDHFKDVDFTRYSFDVVNVKDFILLKNFDSNLLTS